MRSRLARLFLVLGVALLMISAIHATGPNGQPSDGPFLLKITLTFLLPIAAVGTLIICGLPPLKKSLQERGILQTSATQTAKTESKPAVNKKNANLAADRLVFIGGNRSVFGFDFLTGTFGNFQGSRSVEKGRIVNEKIYKRTIAGYGAANSPCALAITAILGFTLPKSAAIPAVCVLVFLILVWLMDWGILRYARSLKERGWLIPQPEKKQIEVSTVGEFLVMTIGNVLEFMRIRNPVENMR